MSKLKEAAEALLGAWRGASLSEMILAVHAIDDALAEDRLAEGGPCPCKRCDYSCEKRRKGEK